MNYSALSQHQDTFLELNRTLRLFLETIPLILLPHNTIIPSRTFSERTLALQTLIGAEGLLRESYCSLVLTLTLGWAPLLVCLFRCFNESTLFELQRHIVVQAFCLVLVSVPMRKFRKSEVRSAVH